MLRLGLAMRRCGVRTGTQRSSLASRAFATNVVKKSVYTDTMYEQWRSNPAGVHPTWATYFQNNPYTPGGAAATSATSSVSVKQDVATKFFHMKKAFQVRGHEIADLDPLRLRERSEDSIPALQPSTYGLSESDMTSKHDLSNMGFPEPITIPEATEHLKSYYCGSIGFQYMHIQDSKKCDWLRRHIEKPPEALSKEEQTKVLERIAFAERFETFLAHKWNTAKRFGIEGCDAMTPGLKTAVDVASSQNVNHIVIGMAHRGRLNVLANVIRKPLELIFKEFAGKASPDLGPDDWAGSGDVKYHLGTSLEREYPDGRKVHLALLHNPSHLECVNPLVNGKARAHMYFKGDSDGSETMPIVIHGDSAFAGQGIVYETMQLCNLKGYQTGGTLHVACNNQVGFTTDPSCARSTPYCSDIGKAFQVPIFHVNADDPEAVCRAFEIATMYRNEFKSDVVVDVLGYRRYGHNELDQPMFTQPSMYKVIDQHPSVLTIHTQRLLARGSFTQEEVDGVLNGVDKVLSDAYDASIDYEVPKDTWKAKGTSWGDVKTPGEFSAPRVTGVTEEVLNKVGAGLVNIPQDFTLHRQLKKIYANKTKMVESGQGIDWGTAEALAIGTLLQEGIHVRLTGQDCERGTFSHRHAKLHDQNTNDTLCPLNQIEGNQQSLEMYNSPLSEFACLGFELGYSMENPQSLVLWEAQFGDFANGAQVITDQFLAAQENKWGRQTGLVMLLPHGYEGQGPEHSSARLERFLSSSDEEHDAIPDRSMQIQRTNWQVVNCTTPGQYFHLLRRQVQRDFRKPLIVMGHKSLLKLRAVQSDLSDFKEGKSFQWLLPEALPDAVEAPDKVRRVVMCSGKVYYELKALREKEQIRDVALVRIEQICPFPFHEVAEQMQLYSNAELVWCQEEPKNMGAWQYVSSRMETATRDLNGKLQRPAYVGRPTMASPAEGYGPVHTRQQQGLIETALSDTVTSYGHGREERWE